MNQLSQYYISRTGNTCHVTIYDSTSYHSYQVYVDEALVTEQLVTSFTVSIPTNKKIDVLGLLTSEAGTDFSNSLSDANGDKIELDVPVSYRGDILSIYSDWGSGVVNYARVLKTIDTSNLSTVNRDGYDQMVLTDYLSMTSSTYDILLTNDTSDMRVVVTDRLQSGTYQIAVEVKNDATHTPLVLSQTIQTRPNEIAPLIASYDPVADKLTISAQSDDAGADVLYNVYTGSWGGSYSTASLSSPFGTAASPQAVISGLRGSTMAGTRHLLMRETKDGLEEKNWNWIDFVVSQGDWLGNFPLPVVGLEADLLVNNTVLLSWGYTLGNSKPDGFRVYANNGSLLSYDTLTSAQYGTLTSAQFDLMTSTALGTLVSTLPYVGPWSILLPAISVETQFIVRAYRGGVDDGNMVGVIVDPLTGSAISMAAVVGTWRDA